MDARTQDLPFGTTAPGGPSQTLLPSHPPISSSGAVRLAGAASDGQAMTPAMALALQANFGSVERWREEFVALGKALGGGPGRVLLTFLPREGTLVNLSSGDPAHADAHAHALAAGITVLALDMNEHGFPLHDGAAAGHHVDAFMASIDWMRAYERYQQAVETTSDALGVSHEDLQHAHLLDVRRAGVFEQADSVIPGARWCDPQAVNDWAAALPRNERVVVYCVYGHEVGRSTAMRLHARGIHARFLRGGIDGWKAAGKPLESRAPGKGNAS